MTDRLTNIPKKDIRAHREVALPKINIFIQYYTSLLFLKYNVQFKVGMQYPRTFDCSQIGDITGQL